MMNVQKLRGLHSFHKHGRKDYADRQNTHVVSFKCYIYLPYDQSILMNPHSAK